MTTQVSNPKSSTVCTTALNKNTDTHGADPYLLRIRAILLPTALAQDKYPITAGQSLSNAKITLPRYLKEVTISRGRP